MQPKPFALPYAHLHICVQVPQVHDWCCLPVIGCRQCQQQAGHACSALGVPVAALDRAQGKWRSPRLANTSVAQGLAQCTNLDGVTKWCACQVCMELEQVTRMKDKDKDKATQCMQSAVTTAAHLFRARPQI